MSDDRLWRLSGSGHSVVTGPWNESRIVFHAPFGFAEDEATFWAWYEAAEEICEIYNNMLQKIKGGE